MKNDNNLYSDSVNKKYRLKTEPSKSYELNSKNKSLKYHLLFPKNNILLERKSFLKPEKINLKENIFQLFKDVPKKQIKKEKTTMKNNINKLMHSISILNNANIDEGIVLNKYFAYLKNYGVEYDKKMKLELENMLKPIRKKEKEIKNMKKNINFYKSISNQMLMKYMIENKDKLNEYMKEISAYKNKNTEVNHDSYRTRNIVYFSDKNNSKSNSYFNNGKKIFNTCSNNNINNKKISLRQQMMNNNKKVTPKMKLKNEENNLFITSYSRNNKKYNSHIRALTAFSSPKSSFSINTKYFTPQTTKRKNKFQITNNEKSTGKTNYSSKKTFKIKDYNFKNIFNRIKIKGLDLKSE